MSDPAQQGHQESLSSALEYLQKALHLLDEAEAPSEMGARLDQIIHELYLVIANITVGSALIQIDRNAVPQ